ncbi:XRE family transcriptional regulator [Streptomyces niveiscabiei]|uniref:hypothetical protein n=1 Tax=Streptomyces TaxID=1883 RepID=UPI00099EA9E7|nr:MULTISPECIES: hypothetical protein [Streptomyces]
MTVQVVGAVPRQPSELRAADSPLGRVRVARGWSQDKVVRALVLLADAWHWRIASEPSLKVYISEWENGARRPGETYRVLLCALYRATPDELGFTAYDKARGKTDGGASELRERVNDLTSMVENLTVALSAAVAGVWA